MKLFDWLKSIWESPPRHRYEAKPKVIRRYDGAKESRLTTDWQAWGTSADAEIFSSLRKLRFRSRALLRDNDYARGIVRNLVHNVVFTGIKLQAEVLTKNKKKLDESINEKIETAWLKWVKHCDVTGYSDFSHIQELVFRSYLESGEVFVRKVFQRFGKSKVSLGLEVIEADQVADDRLDSILSSKSGNQVKMGVELDQWNRPVAYWVYTSHPGEYGYGQFRATDERIKRIPAEEIIHIYLKERPGQTRGVPHLYSSIIRLRNLKEYENSEQIAARAGANIAALVTTEQGDLLDEPEIENSEADVLDDDDTEEIIQYENSKPTEALEAGGIIYLDPGEKMQAFIPNRPNGQLPAFQAYMLQGISAGCGVSYESTSHNYSRSNYSSSRLALLTSRDHWRVLQAWFTKVFLMQVYEAWFDRAILGGVLTFADYELDEDRYLACKWKYRGWEWVDPDKEAKALQKLLDLGLTSRIKECAKNGQDFEEIIKDLSKEQDILEKYGIKLHGSGSSNFNANSNGGNKLNGNIAKKP